MTGTAKKLTPSDAPALVVRMPLRGRPARLVSMFGLLMSQFSGDSITVELQPQETLFFGLLRKRIVNRELSAEALVGAYLHSIGTMTGSNRTVSITLEGGVTEFKVIRNGVCISLQLLNREGKPPESVLHVEGAAQKLTTIRHLGGDLGATLEKKIWTGSDGERSANFADAFDYWFQQAMEFSLEHNLG